MEGRRQGGVTRFITLSAILLSAMSGAALAQLAPSTPAAEWPAAPKDAPASAAPAQARYGAFPEQWIAPNLARYKASRPKTIMSLGDSLSESRAFLWLARYAPSGIADQEGYLHLDKELGTLSGQRSDWGRRRADVACGQGRAELVTVLFGTNDLIHQQFRPDRFRDNLQRMVDTCLAYGSLPMLMTLPPLRWQTGAVASANRIVRDIARTRQLPLFDFGRILVERGQLRADMPDGVHPNRAAYEIINSEWIKFYKYIEHHVLAPGRRRVLPDVAVEQKLEWDQVFDWRPTGKTLPAGFEARGGEWRIEGGALVGVASGNAPAWLLIPIKAPGRVRVEIEAESDGAEISVVLHSGGDPALTGVYYGYGTNGGARTAINIDDARAAQVEGARPKANQRHRLRATLGQRYARLGVDGRYLIDHVIPPTTPKAGLDRIALYTWEGALKARRIQVWVEPSK